MLKNIIKYGIILIVVVGIGLVLKNVITSSKDNSKNEEQKPYYQITISLLDKETGSFIKGSDLVVKNESSEIIEKWTTSDNAYIVTMVPKGKYTLEQMSASTGYDLNEEVITFTVSDKDLKLVMYNSLAKKSSENSSSKSEVTVGNTLSIKSPLVVIVSIIIIGLGTMLILFRKKITE